MPHPRLIRSETCTIDTMVMRMEYNTTFTQVYVFSFSFSLANLQFEGVDNC